MKISKLSFTADENTRIEKYLNKIKKNLEKDKLTPLERVKISEKHEEPDRVPLNIFSESYNPIHAGYKICEVLTNPKKGVIADLAFVAEGWTDLFIIYTESHIIGLEAMGAKVNYPEDSTAYWSFPIKTIDDVDKLEILDPYTDGNIPMVLQMCEFFREELGDTFQLWQNLCGPLGLAGDLAGYDKVLLASRRDPDFLKALLKKCTEINIVISKALQEAGVVALHWDALAAPLYLGIPAYEKFVWPCEKELFQRVPPEVCLGIDGNVTQILERMADSGAKRIFMEDDTDYAKAKQLVGKRVTCMMAYIRTDPLLNGTPEEIAAMAKDIIKIAAPGGGFILNAGVLPIGAPERNCAAVIEAVRKYGTYPINLG